MAGDMSNKIPLTYTQLPTFHLLSVRVRTYLKKTAKLFGLFISLFEIRIENRVFLQLKSFIAYTALGG